MAGLRPAMRRPKPTPIREPPWRRVRGSSSLFLLHPALGPIGSEAAEPALNPGVQAPFRDLNEGPTSLRSGGLTAGASGGRRRLVRLRAHPVRAHGVGRPDDNDSLGAFSRSSITSA